MMMVMIMPDLAHHDFTHDAHDDKDHQALRASLGTWEEDQPLHGLCALVSHRKERSGRDERKGSTFSSSSSSSCFYGPL